MRKKSLEAKLKFHNPELYGEYRTSRNVHEAVATVTGLATLILTAASFLQTEHLLPAAPIFVLGLVVTVIIAKQGTHHAILENFEQDLFQQEHRTQTEIENMSEVLNEAHFANRGINITAGHQATVIVNSKVVNSFNSMEVEEPEVAKALATVAALVEERGDENSAAALEDLIEEIDGRRKTSRLRATWDYLVKTLPDVAKLTSAVAVISKLF